MICFAVKSSMSDVDSGKDRFSIFETGMWLNWLSTNRGSLHAGRRTRTFEGTKPLCPKPNAFDRFAIPAANI